MRVLGLDVGTVRIGVAVSDEERTFAQPLTAVDARNPGCVDEVARLCARWDVDTVVVGLPLSMDGGERGTSARAARAFGQAVAAAAGVRVVYVDERFSTVVAESALRTGGVRGTKRRAKVDKVAAAVILQGYLDGNAAP